MLVCVQVCAHILGGMNGEKSRDGYVLIVVVLHFFLIGLKYKCLKYILRFFLVVVGLIMSETSLLKTLILIMNFTHLQHEHGIICLSHYDVSIKRCVLRI